MSTAGTIILVTFVMIFVAGMNMKIVGVMFASGIGLFLALGLTSEYRLKRILSFLDPFQDPLGSGYQVIQGLYALGSGGLFGIGFRQEPTEIVLHTRTTKRFYICYNR